MKLRYYIYACILFVLLFVIIDIMTFGKIPKENIDCSPGYFYLHGMDDCHPWLTCTDLKDIELKEMIGLGAVKVVYRGLWNNNMSIAVSKLNNENFIEDFRHGTRMLKTLNPSPYVVQIVGICETRNIILTEYHKYGSALNITHLLPRNEDGVVTRLKLCLNYALLLEYLHDGPAGHRVMCDSNTLEKALGQLLVTDQLLLILNDLDALPEIHAKQNVITCGNKPLHGNFIAPEQQWPKTEGYDEKTDIWKAASVCDYFIGSVPKSDMVRYKLFFIHKKCKSINSTERPSATQLAAQYIKILYELQGEL